MKSVSDARQLTISVTPELYAVLEQMRDAGFWGDGRDVISVAEELIRIGVRTALTAIPDGEHE